MSPVVLSRCVLFNDVMASFPVIQLTEGEWTSEKWYDILGVKLPNFFTSDPAFLRDYIFNFKTRPDDVFTPHIPNQVRQEVKLAVKEALKLCDMVVCKMVVCLEPRLE